MNDLEIMSNYLSILKSNVEVYVHGTIESSNYTSKDILLTCLNDTLDMQKDTFDKMVQNNMYKVDNISNNEIKKVYQKLTE